MKVLLFNGSPHIQGCTYTALREIADELEREGVETEIFHIGLDPIRGCIGCGRCRELGKCVFDDVVNVAAEKVKEADGFIFGSPVHYAAASGAMTCFMDRLFYSAGKNFAFKPGACISSARRGVTSATYDQVNQCIGISKIIMVPSKHWNLVHGIRHEDVKQVKEGLQRMRN